MHRRLNPRSTRPYSRTVLKGLYEAFGWSADERVRYLSRAAGVTPAWAAGRLAALRDGAPTAD